MLSEIKGKRDRFTFVGFDLFLFLDSSQRLTTARFTDALWSLTSSDVLTLSKTALTST